MPTYKTLGLILKRKDFWEADRILTIYTRDYGKIEALAQGLRKVKSKLAGHLEPLTLSRLMFAAGKNFERVASAVTEKNFRKLKSSLLGVGLASYIVEIVDSLTKERHRDVFLFDLLLATLKELELVLSKEKQRILLINAFILKLLAHLGYQPILEKCFVCKKEVKRGKYFLTGEGILCLDCQKGHPASYSFSPEAIGVMNFLGQKRFREINSLQAEVDLVKEVNKGVNLFLHYHLDKELKSERFLRELKNLA